MRHQPATRLQRKDRFVSTKKLYQIRGRLMTMEQALKFLVWIKEPSPVNYLLQLEGLLHDR